MEKYKESIELAEQITRYLKGTLSEEERVELERKLRERPDGERLLVKVKDQKAISAKRELYGSFDPAKCWSKIHQKTGKKSSRSLPRVVWYAAILALPLVVGASIWVMNRMEVAAEKSQYIVAANFEPHKVFLELPGERYIALDTAKNITEQLNEFGVTVESEYGLDYSKKHADSLAPIEYHRIVVPRGGEYNVKLADGSSVWLFAESEIRFPVRFTGKRREVFLSGEAFFEVQHDPSHPFYVKTKGLDVKVLGTSFNVKAYDRLAFVETSLVEGLVSVKDNILRPDMQAVFDKHSGDISYRKVNGENYRLRKEQMFVFDEERLDNILQEMARWYDFEIFYQNPEMADKRFGFKLKKYENVDALFKILELTGEVEFEMKGKTLIVKSGSV